ncbi:substrate-binding domain-containing protein [Pseudoxanthomonas dokdonensis]|uniref:OmpA-like domain-containing protein n=1 Tax=Pseudoxanthomonas dokdonensis TaxID=344882 RepID=A0A0R0CTP9_9GAMM|nr:substrate-binding domain-containing protein [Pseudoxanthomonas dokdonensis]KRG68996.1 hypothetical protein ABB29_11185 [Pseudoxanthomonas dokdonensis]
MFTNQWRRCALLCLLLASACASAQDQDAERLRIHGSNTIGRDLMPALVDAWLRSLGFIQIQRRDINAALTELHATRDGLPLIVEIEKKGSGLGFADLVEGQAELAMMAQPLTARQLEDGWQLGDLHSPEQEFVLALDGLAVVVNEASPLRALSTQQLAAILDGRITRWSQLGGADLPLDVHSDGASSGTRDFIRQRLLAGAQVRRPIIGHAELAQAAQAVSKDPSALALVGLDTPLPANVRALPVSDTGIAVAPDPVGVGSEDYPLTRRYVLRGGPLMSALGRSLALYAVGSAGQRAVQQAGYRSLRLRQVDGTGTPDPRTPYGEAVAGATRLPLSLRFNLGSLTTYFESRSAGDMERVVAFMREPANRGRKLVVAAFTNDDPGNRLVPTMVSNERADIVAGHLIREGIPVVRALGLGGSRPLASSATEAGRVRNERVELWLQ